MIGSVSFLFSYQKNILQNDETPIPKLVQTVKMERIGFKSYTLELPKQKEIVSHRVPWRSHHFLRYCFG